MTDTITRTLEATLVSPTAHKERKLRELVRYYRDALEEAFSSGCGTMSAVNDVVTPYDLPYQAKDALKRYVPRLLGTYRASELRDDHPVRFVNRAARFDRDPDRTYSICWQVPQPGRGTNFWIPLRINPAQAELWSSVLDGEASAGEIRLQRHRSAWILHVTIRIPVEEPSYSTHDNGATYIGLDIGESALVTGCALERGLPMDPILCDGGRAKRLRKEMHTTLTRLQERGAAEWRIRERFEHYQNALTDIIEKVSRRVIDYALEYDKPVVVMEDLSSIRDELDYGPFMNRRLHSWAFGRLRSRIEDKALDDGIPVLFVRPEYTSKKCHACKHLGARPSQGTFRCRNDDCHVTDFQADINAAANVARRADPWGESVPLKPGRDDSPRDGSPRDRASGPSEWAASTEPSSVSSSPGTSADPSSVVPRGDTS